MSAGVTVVVVVVAGVPPHHVVVDSCINEAHIVVESLIQLLPALSVA